MRKVLVRCEDSQTVAHGNGADQKVRIGPLDSLASTQVKKLGCRYIVLGDDRDIGEGG